MRHRGRLAACGEWLVAWREPGSGSVPTPPTWFAGCALGPLETLQKPCGGCGVDTPGPALVRRATGPLGTDALWRRGLLLHGGVGAWLPLHLRVLALPGQAMGERDVHQRHRMEEKLQIDLNITQPALPCELISDDVQDVMGSHEVDALGDLFNGRLTSKGDVIAKEEIHGSRHGQYWGLTRHFNFGYDNGDVDRIKNMVHSGEGCKVPGYVCAWEHSHLDLQPRLPVQFLVSRDAGHQRLSPCGSCV